MVGAYPAINSLTRERDAVRNDSARQVFMGIVIAMVATITSKDDFWNIMVLQCSVSNTGVVVVVVVDL